MAIAHTPRLDTNSWEINGVSLTAWINDLECFEIVHDPKTDYYRLTLNHAGTGAAWPIGSYGRITDAQRAAKIHIGDNE